MVVIRLFLQFKSQNMAECNFCRSNSQENYLYTECSHFVCLPCAGLKWDRKYSIKCCNITTFLEEETCNALEKLNQLEEHRKNDAKENIPSSPPFPEKAQTTATRNTKEDYNPKPREIHPSIYISQPEPKPVEKRQPMDERRNDSYLSEMQEIMNESVQRVRYTFDSYRKELERKEESLLKEVYNKFSDQFTKYAVTEEDTKQFKERLNRLIAEEIGSLTKIAYREPEGKPDKILEKLEYNQMKMKQKLSRHYDLLK